MRVQEIASGLWRWTGLHPDWTPAEGGPEGWDAEVGCLYAETPGAVVLIDPLVPPEDADRFWAALDRDVERAASPVHVLQTVFWHSRSAAAMRERYDAEIWAHARVLEEERREVDPTRTFDAGEALPGGIEAYLTSRRDEVVLWLPEHNALAFGDVLLGADDGGVRLCPDAWLDDQDSAGLRDALRPLLELPVERLLVSHGAPVLRDGQAALARALADHAPSAAYTSS